MTKISKKNIILVPQNISVVYCDTKQILVFLGPIKQTSLKLDVKIFLTKNRYIEVSKIPFTDITNVTRKKLKIFQGSTVAQIKQAISESRNNCYANLKFVGLGYRAMLLENYNDKVLLLKLGYSHLIYCKIPDSCKTTSFKKLTNLFISGTSYKSVKQISSIIRSFRPPEPYKGKGVLYLNEKINKKQGKRI